MAPAPFLRLTGTNKNKKSDARTIQSGAAFRDAGGVPKLDDQGERRTRREVERIAAR
jgi:hypothetical protein